MSAEETLALVREVLETHERNYNDEDGDKFLSDTNLAIEAITYAVSESPRAIPWLTKNHWIAREDAS